MLLFVRRDEIVEAEFHHRHMQQVGGFDGERLTMFSGKFQRHVKHFIVIHFQADEDFVRQILLEQREPGLKLRFGQQRLARRPPQPRLSPRDMEDFYLVEAREQNGRRVLQHDGLSGGRIGFLPVKLEQKTAVEVGPQKRSSLSWASSSVAVGPAMGAG